MYRTVLGNRVNSIGIFLYYVFEKKETAANPIMMYLVLIFTLCRVVTKSYLQAASGRRQERRNNTTTTNFEKKEKNSRSDDK